MSGKRLPARTVRRVVAWVPRNRGNGLTWADVAWQIGKACMEGWGPALRVSMVLLVAELAWGMAIGVAWLLQGLA